MVQAKDKMVDLIFNRMKNVPIFMSSPDMHSYIASEIDDAVGKFMPNSSTFSGKFTIDSYFGSKVFADSTMKPTAGFQAKLSNGQLSNSPAETATNFEVTNADRYTISTYNKMDKDPILALGKIVLSGMIGSLRFSINCKDPIIEKVVYEGYKNFHNEVVSNSVTIGRKLGWAFGEKTYKKQLVKITDVDDTGKEVIIYEGEITGLSDINFINPEQDLTYWKDKKTGKLAYVEQTKSSGKVKCVRSKLYWLALDSEFGNIFGESSYRRAYPYWYYDKINFQLMFKHLERSGSPHLEVRYPNGNQFDDAGNSIPNDVVMKNIVLGLFSNSIAAMPNETDSNGKYTWTAEYKEAKNQNITPYLNFKELSDSKKLQSIYVPEASLMNSSFSETDAKIDILMIIGEHIVNQIEVAIKKDIIDSLVEYNFGPEHIDKVTFNIDRTGLGRRTLIKELFLQSLRAGNNIKGYHVKTWLDFEKALTEMGMPIASFDKNFNLDPNAAPMEDLGAIDQNIEDSNGQNRATPDNRKRGRDAANKNAADNTTTK